MHTLKLCCRQNLHNLTLWFTDWHHKIKRINQRTLHAVMFGHTWNCYTASIVVPDGYMVSTPDWNTDREMWVFILLQAIVSEKRIKSFFPFILLNYIYRFMNCYCLLWRRTQTNWLVTAQGVQLQVWCQICELLLCLMMENTC